MDCQNILIRSSPPSRAEHTWQRARNLVTVLLRVSDHPSFSSSLLSTGHWTHDCWLRPPIKQLSTISTIIFIYNLQAGIKMKLDTGCFKTSCKFLRLVTQSFLGLFPLFWAFLYHKLWAIFHSGTSWTWNWKKKFKNLILQKSKISGLAQIS